VATSEAKQQQPEALQLLDAGGVVTLKERAMKTTAFRMLQDFMDSKVGGRIAHHLDDVPKAFSVCLCLPKQLACARQQAVLPTC
jgi:hypothetical protein